MSKQEFTPCPFCGTNEMLKVKSMSHGISFIHCEFCGAVCSFCGNEKRKEAIQQWNARKLTPMQKAAPDMYEALSSFIEIFLDTKKYHDRESVTTKSKEAFAQGLDALKKAQGNS